MEEEEVEEGARAGIRLGNGVPTRSGDHGDWRRQDEKEHPWSTHWSVVNIGLGAPGQGWYPRARLEVSESAQHGHG